jgi:malonyl CoA-acyl carrier protein transacylase
MEAFIFPGQGSQRKGMGGDLFESIKDFRAIESRIDQILGYSLRELCLDNPDNRLMETQFTQPALYVVNYLYYCKKRDEAPAPAYLAGHSLGEFNALLAAGAFDVLTGLRIVKMRGEIMARAKNGAMAAVVGRSPANIRSFLADSSATGVDIANYNTPSQTVISGPIGEIDRVEKLLSADGAIAFFRLPVSSAFHSRYMQEAAEIFQDSLSSFEFNNLRLPVISNVTAEPYSVGSTTEDVRSMLVKQIVSPVRWEETIRFLKRKGVTSFNEVGPGNVLTRLTPQIPE